MLLIDNLYLSKEMGNQVFERKDMKEVICKFLETSLQELLTRIVKRVRK